MKNRSRYLVAVLALSLGLMTLTGGCGQLKEKETESETVQITESETAAETESETETETEPELDVAYTSQDKSIRIVLPDSTWKVTQDADEMRVFSSGAAMINIVHAQNESQMKNTASVAKSEEELKENLTKQYPDANSFEIQSFVAKSTDTLDTYEYVVKYNATSMWAYAVTYGIMARDQAYIVSGTVTDDNKTLLAAVVKSVESFTVLNNSVFSVTSGSTEETDQSESQKQSESGTTGSEELGSLQDYGTAATLYASDNVNIRLEPSTEADILGSLSTGDQISVVGETSQWFKVNINGNVGYISKQFLISTPPQTQNNDTSEDGDQSTGENQAPVSDEMAAEYGSQINYGSTSTYYATSDVNLRAEPGTDASVLGSVNNGTPISVIGETDNWYIVSVNGSTAYVSKSYVSTQNPGNSTSEYEGSTGTSDMGEVIDAGDAGNSEDDNTGTDTSGENSGNSGQAAAGGSISGTITSAGVDSIVIAGDDGNTYTINTGDAAVSTSDGIYEGLYVTATVDSAVSSGTTLHATSVSGN
ncbi:MAG: SH3 domain-containing protein [Lachnospiraceae bacterium]|nr:SH3 domain-containing protein [Lachnospiraceae bacterium]